MKKILLAILMLLTTICLTGCNKMILDIDYKFEKCHFHDKDICLNIKSWNDYDGEQIQIKLEDGTVILTSSYNAMLIKGKCPFCGD